MHICYVDESGDTLPFPITPSSITPVLVFAGVIIDQCHLYPLTLDFLNLKEKYFPDLTNGVRPLHRVLIEIKGSDIRRNIRIGKRNKRRHLFGFLDKILALLELYDAKIIARILIKHPGKACNEVAIYTSCIQAVCETFQVFLNENKDRGVLIADSRHPYQNTQVSHSVFTQKFKLKGDRYDKIYEMPLFGHSDNHIGLQLADILASAILFPMSTATYCIGTIPSVHADQKFLLIKNRYSERIKKMQYRFIDEWGRWRGGLTVSDDINHRSSAELFR